MSFLLSCCSKASNHRLQQPIFWYFIQAMDETWFNGSLQVQNLQSIKTAHNESVNNKTGPIHIPSHVILTSQSFSPL